MNLFKTLLLAVSLFSFIGQTSAQVNWATCGSTAGELSGTMTTILPSATTPAPSFTTSSAGSNITHTEFIIVLQDSLADDSLGNAILGTSLTGQVMPSTYGLTDGDTFYIVPFSYNLQDVKEMFQAVLHHNAGILGGFAPCCTAIANSAGIAVCDSLNAGGIIDSSDINNAGDLLAALQAFQGGGSNSVSVEGTIFALDTINDQAALIDILGCTGNHDAVCYAASPNASAYDFYAVQVPTAIKRIAGEDQLAVAVAPNPFNTTLSATVYAAQTTTHQLRMLDVTGKTVLSQSHDLQAGVQVVSLELGHLSAGVYFMQVSDGKNISTQKLIKR
ncbi:MAG: T9SS type A sorting domain-containing protein [Aureispira sp.]|nr:T9SS type A sorting domain-containing protein [Aureispira sp.]